MMRRKNDQGWFLLGMLAGPIGVAMILAAALMITLAVMI